MLLCLQGLHQGTCTVLEASGGGGAGSERGIGCHTAATVRPGVLQRQRYLPHSVRQAGSGAGGRGHSHTAFSAGQLCRESTY